MEITIEKYQNIVRMLQSTDAENHTVALGIIDNLEFKENKLQILLMLKHSKASPKTWADQAPNIWKKMEKLHDKGIIGDINRNLTYKQVLSIITTMKLKPKDFDFYMKDFSNYLMEQVKSLGYDFIESMEIKIKYKEHEQSRELSES